jgi:hypothetical protein
MPGTDELASQYIYSINMPFQGLIGREPGLLALLLQNKTLEVTEFDALFIHRTINVRGSRSWLAVPWVTCCWIAGHPLGLR